MGRPSKPSQTSEVLKTSEVSLQAMRALIRSLAGETTVVDFEEVMQLPSVRETTRLWYQGKTLLAFAFVDDFNNLYFEMDREAASRHVEDEVIAWGIRCVRERNAATGQHATLDACFSTKNTWQIALLERSGFTRAEVRTLRYARALEAPMPEQPLPAGFTLRHVGGEGEVEDLVRLHRAAFGTEQMTVERRLAIMRAPGYVPELDLLAVAPDGELAAFCICGFESADTGYTDPIGTHPRWQRRGLGKALVTAGLMMLKERGARSAVLGTSSENLSMQRLAEALGFVLVEEKIWFEREVG